MPLNKNKKVLMLYPKYNETFWSFSKILKIIGKKSTFPPLGLLTISSMLPEGYEKKLIDLNFQTLKETDIIWADIVFVSAMIIQKESADAVIKYAKTLGKTVVAGGPLFTTGWEDFEQNVDCLFLGEAEEIFPGFLEDLEGGKLKKFYKAEKFPSIANTPVPDWSLINISKYNSMCIQYSRGCPFNCEFCDIIKLNGRTPRTKSSEQLVAELDALLENGYKGGIFFVDDNFIGNRKRLKDEILPEIIKWQEKNNFPFLFNTQTSIDLADDDKLLELMIKAGFVTVFIGIETPDAESLEECNKLQNKKTDMMAAVKKIQNAGIEIQAGFIVGFDSDNPSIFARQIEFIQKSGIVTAMVGVLTALPKTKLYQRLSDTGRLLKDTSSSNTRDSVLNFIPKMDKKILLDGYRNIVKTIYSPKDYYERIKTFLLNFKPPKRKTPTFKFYYITALLSSIWLLGIVNKGRRYYWKLILWSLFKKPGVFPYAIGYSIIGIHFRGISKTV
jgi:radical SAM superfamily enzyme YgiQ (UPF0313 family)